MGTFDEALHSMWHGDFVTRRGWNDKSKAVRYVAPYSDNKTIGQYKHAIFEKDYLITKEDKDATDWIAISNREAKDGDADF